MDTLFRLVSLQSSDQQQQSSFNSSRTSTSSRSTKSNYQYQYQQQYQQQQQQQQANYFLQKPYNSSSQEEEEGEECNNHHHYMDEDFSSSSSSKHFLPNNPTPTPPPSTVDFSFPQGINLNLSGGAGWANNLLTECARSVATRDTQRTQQLMWALNELSSPYGDTEQKVAAYFLQGLFARLTSSGPRTLRTLSSACDRTASFDSTRRVALRFQELSPWSTFGHVAANGAILESFLEGGTPPMRLHILDLSNTFCTQWPTLLEALATRSADDTPHLSITTVVSSPSSSSSAHRVMKEIAARMEKFARLMGVPFAFNTIHHGNDLSTLDLDLDQLNIQYGDDTALAVNCVNALHGVSPSNSRRESILASLRRLSPRIVTIVEEEADLEVIDEEEEEEAFLKGFRESLRFFSAYFDSLEESFPKTSNERLALERSAGRAVVDLVACPASESAERRGTGCGWSARMMAAGFSPAPFSDDVTDDIRALLRRYREGWSMEAENPTSGAAGVFLAWKEQPVVWASAWKLL